MKIRSIPDLQGFPALRGRIIVDTYRGQVRIRSWPRKQSAETKRKNANQIRWFAAAREMAKWAEPSQIALSKEVVKGTGLYPGDLQMLAAAGNLIPVIFNDPVNYTKWLPRIDPVSFQGAQAPLAANQVMPATVVVTAVWGLPNFQSTQFWEPGAPTRFTILPGITKVQLVFTYNITVAAQVFLGASITDKTGALMATNQHFTTTIGAGIISTGPLAVVAGDWFEAKLQSNLAGTLLKASNTHFSIEVLEAA